MSNDDKVVNLGDAREEMKDEEEFYTTGKVSVKKVVEAALEDCENWDEVLILATTKDGVSDCRASTGRSSDLLFLVESFKHNVVFSD